MTGKLLVLVCCHLVSMAATKVVRMDQNAAFRQDHNLRLPPPGVFRNCGNNSTEALMTWYPAKMRFGDTVHISCHFVPPVDVSVALFKAWAYLPGQTDTLYFTGSRMTCDDIHVYFKFLCPFYKNKLIDIKNYEVYLSPTLGFPAGTFTIKLKLFSITEEELLCLFGTVTILDD